MMGQRNILMVAELQTTLAVRMTKLQGALLAILLLVSGLESWGSSRATFTPSMRGTCGGRPLPLMAMMTNYGKRAGLRMVSRSVCACFISAGA